MRKNNIVAEYDYYTLDQARQIILAENREKRRKIFDIYITAALMVIIPVLFFIDWLIVGY